MKEVITQAIADSLIQLGLPLVPFAVEHPADLSHGDYACNVAMILGKQVNKDPRVVADELITVLTDQIEYVESITIAGQVLLTSTSVATSLPLKWPVSTLHRKCGGEMNHFVVKKLFLNTLARISLSHCILVISWAILLVRL